MTVPLSVLDLSPVPAGGTPADALHHTLDLARAAERAGYLRYWVAEHHLVPGVASSSTSVLVAHLAAATTTIRVGSGAVQLPHTAPIQIAEQFGTTAALYPGRVDLGLGRFDLQKILAIAARGAGPAGPGGEPAPARVVGGLLIPRQAGFIGDLSQFVALAGLLGISPDSPPQDYHRQVADVLSYVEGTATDADGRPLTVLPAEGADLDVWVLGSSAGTSADVAGALGLPFAASYHTVPHTVLETVAAYRAAFRPSARLARPHVMVSADVVVAETDERARDLAAPYGGWVLDIRAGRGAQPYPTPAQARARAWTDAERAAVTDRVDTQFVGSPGTVAAGLETLVRVTGADELLVTTITTDHADRVASHELLAAEWAHRGAGALRRTSA
ncbi:LLM class flavin-dependent oxidoreductase [Pseudonocardia sp. N23]|uniref:LLM class flavin-dependent oxidoreductase n=1 Tax=Pseudonocardia sp. N23 TaxID=1987376 RepID=UPI000BFBA4FA|nr:LLM class flavin-dependent oxidoreductase [Pseudonocardia sp. N23]GAY08002.1 luciferase-like monooxygenase [Pseudonocardia sp. N23]